MGEVVEAEHVALGKRVVVKLLHKHHAARQDFADRMRIEAQALANITHPNLVQVTDFGQTAEGRTYLVMERLYGRNLREELDERGPLPVLEAIDIVRQALAGLSAAHAAGVVHRDVKLDNLFLCNPVEGRRAVKVLDFGVAKVIAVMGETTPAPLAFPTAEGVAMGTPRFFSPEQARGLPIDPRTDVYAAGAVLYTLVAGRSPFEELTTLLEIARAHAFETPEPPSYWAAQAIPRELDEAIMKALAKAPEDRFESALAFAAELERIAGHVASSGAVVSRWERTEVMPGAPPTHRTGLVSPTEPPAPGPERTTVVDALVAPRDTMPTGLPPEMRHSSAPPTTRNSAPPTAHISAPPTARISAPPTARISAPPTARISAPPTRRISSPPEAYTSTPPEARTSAPPPDDALPYRRTLATPLPATVKTPEHAEATPLPRPERLSETPLPRRISALPPPERSSVAPPIETPAPLPDVAPKPLLSSPPMTPRPPSSGVVATSKPRPAPVPWRVRPASAPARARTSVPAPAPEPEEEPAPEETAEPLAPRPAQRSPSPALIFIGVFLLALIVALLLTRR
ncbi:protein kinase [Polyangium aurulentum]|nr:protein kinase [Polyangium aurulentum]